MCVFCVYLLCINTHTCSIYFENIYVYIYINIIYIINSAVKRLISSKIKVFFLHNTCVCTVYIYVYINTHIYGIDFENIYMYIFIFM